jgi:SAM-dependent methyltransferase
LSHVPLEHLEAIYASSDDPWDFRGSAYEQEKFRATRRALPRAQYRSVLEVGCGNGELARHLISACATYTGVDAIEVALDAARKAVPRGTFHRIYLPAELPAGCHDLLVFSEVLYFLGSPELVALARQIDRRWPDADLVCVNWLGDSGNPLQGREALKIFSTHLARPKARGIRTDRYSIDTWRGTE